MMELGAKMDNLTLSASPAVTSSNSRSTSPVRPKGLNISARHNVNATKKSEPLIVRGRKKSPVPVRKGTPEGAQQLTGSTVALVGPNTLTVAGGSSSSGSGINTRSHSVSLPGSQDDTLQPTSTALEDSDLTLQDMTSNLSGSMSNGSSSELLVPIWQDDVDMGTGTPDLQRTKAALDHIHLKILRTKDMIKQEQTSRDENVNEYLKLAANADKQQLQRIKSVFEKKNQKSAQTIAHFQKKLDNYGKRIKELELYGVVTHRQPKEVLRDVSQGLKDVGANIRDGITGFSGGVVGNIKGGLSGLSQATQSAAETVMSKPREFAHLIKNKFGSADNINSMTKPGEEVSGENGEKNHHSSATFTHSTKYPSDDECSSVTSGSGPITGTGTGTGTGTMSSPHNQPHQAVAITPGLTSTVVATVGPLGAPPAAVPYNVEPLLQELQERQEDCMRLNEEMESLKSHFQQEMTYFNQTLQEERYRYERLEEQMNDLIELHQNEIENLKQGITDMEEKVQYQSEERLRDMHDVLDNCQTRISRLEHQQHQQQQLVTLEGIENSNARALVLKLINVVLTVLQVVLLLVATVSNILMPFLKTRVRILTTTLLVVAVLFACRQWSDVVSYSQRLFQRYGFASAVQ